MKMTPGPDADVLAGVPLFRGLTHDRLSKLAALLNRRSFPAGVRVITAEDPGEDVYFVLEGSVKVHVDQPDGGEVVLAVLGPGEVVGEMNLADSLGRSANVTTLEKTRFLWLARAAFRASVEETPVMALNLADVLSRRLRLANTHLRYVAALDVHGRVAAQLLAFAQEYGQETPEGLLIPLRLTQADLAGLVGASRVRVNQVLGFFKGRGYLSVGEDRRITVHDRAALARRAR